MLKDLADQEEREEKSSIRELESLAIIMESC